jgi:large subunit ribosomal protein L18
MSKRSAKIDRLERRKKSIRRKIAGTADCPRLAVNRTLSHISAQLIDDTTGRTLAAASSRTLKTSGGNVSGAKDVGKALAESAKAASITQVRFDRRGRLFHGRVKALADAAREGGLKF